MKVSLKVISGPHTGREFNFEEHDTFIVGRASYAHFRLSKKDQFFSRAHFLIEVNPPFCRLMDMASTNGTIVNKEKVTDVDLKDGDLIQGGGTTIRVTIENGGEIVQTNQAVSKNDSKDSEEAPASPAHHTMVERQPKLPASPRQTNVEQVPSAAADANFSKTQSQPSLPSTAQLGTIAQYRLVRELGRGGMGVVYLATKGDSNNLVALKTIKPTMPVTSRDFDRFLREASILCELEHPHIVRFLELGECEKQLYFVMEYVPGKNASQLLTDQGALPVGRAVSLVCQLLEALEDAHSRQFVHRDIKPANLLIGEQERGEFVKLADFGLARVYHSSRLSGLTMHGEMGGSIAYIAPEQITNYRDSEPPGDLYSTAATLYKMLTDQYVYDFPPQLNKRVLMILQDDPIPITDRDASIPPALAHVIHTALSRKPNARYSSAKVMRQALLPFAKTS